MPLSQISTLLRSYRDKVWLQITFLGSWREGDHPWKPLTSLYHISDQTSVQPAKPLSGTEGLSQQKHRKKYFLFPSLISVTGEQWKCPCGTERAHISLLIVKGSNFTLQDTTFGSWWAINGYILGQKECLFPSWEKFTGNTIHELLLWTSYASDVFQSLSASAKGGLLWRPVHSNWNSFFFLTI